MGFNLIDMEKFKHASRYKYFFNDCRCNFSMTANIDITKFLSTIKKNNLKFYPCYIYIVSKIVNKYDEYKMAVDAENKLGVWDELNPCYPNFHEDDETISMLWTDYKNNFDEFYNDFIKESEVYKNKRGYFVKGVAPKNIFQVSCIPWIKFTSMNFQLFYGGTYLFPIITCGKYFEQGGKILLPVSVQLHHAVCDGYHMCRFFNELQKEADEF